MPSRLTRIAAQVVPQIRISAASAAVVRRRVGFMRVLHAARVFVGAGAVPAPAPFPGRGQAPPLRKTPAGYKPVFYSIAEARTRGLWVDSVQRPRVRDGLAEMGQPRHPGHEALDAHAETAVRIGAVLAHV